MKVIAVDNFDRENVDDVLIKDNLSKEEADKIAKDYNDNIMSDNHPIFYKAVDDNYKLFKVSDLY